MLEQLHEFDIDISSGQINRILLEGHEGFHKEKDDILTTALEISSYVNVDDTGPAIMEKTGSALTSAMNCLPGLKAQSQKAA